MYWPPFWNKVYLLEEDGLTLLLIPANSEEFLIQEWKYNFIKNTHVMYSVTGTLP